jgi:hypothetical protein
LQWDRFFPEYFGFTLSVSFDRCSITRKSEKNVIIIITGLHNKPQGCGAFVASAAGPFNKKNQVDIRNHTYGRPQLLTLFIVCTRKAVAILELNLMKYYELGIVFVLFIKLSDRL